MSKKEEKIDTLITNSEYIWIIKDLINEKEEENKTKSDRDDRLPIKKESSST